MDGNVTSTGAENGSILREQAIAVMDVPEIVMKSRLVLETVRKVTNLLTPRKRAETEWALLQTNLLYREYKLAVARGQVRDIARRWLAYNNAFIDVMLVIVEECLPEKSEN